MSFRIQTRWINEFAFLIDLLSPCCSADLFALINVFKDIFEYECTKCKRLVFAGLDLERNWVDVEVTDAGEHTLDDYSRGILEQWLCLLGDLDVLESVVLMENLTALTVLMNPATENNDYTQITAEFSNREWSLV